MALMRRGRWSNPRTLERYVQEGVYSVGSTQLTTEAQARLNCLAGLNTAIVSGYCQSLVDLFKAVKEEIEEVATLSDHNINEKTAKVFSAVVRMIDMSR